MGVAFLEWIADKEFIRAFRGRPVGVGTQGQSHKFDHITRVVAGTIHVHATAPDGTLVFDQEFTAPAEFLVRAQVWHLITPLTTDAEYHCVWPHRNANGEIVDRYVKFDEAYR